MNLKGTKINFLGDSITQGCGTTNEAEKRFSTLIGYNEGAVVRNYGIGGTRIAVQKAPSAANPIWDRDFCSRVAEMDPDADAIVVFGGTNDYGHGDAPFGTFADRTPDTFYGACHTLMQSLITKYPGAVIVFMTPLHRTGEDNPRFDGKTLVDFVDALKEVARYYSLPVLDLYAMSGLQPNVPVIKEKFCPDGLHPNDAGHVILAERIANFLKAL